MDGRVDKTETSLLSEIKRILNITDDIIIKSRLLSLDEIINILKAMSDVKKIVLLKYMAKMALVDGQITREEDYGVLHIAKLFNLPKKVISSVKVPVSLNISSPIVAYALATKVVRGDFDKMSLTIDAEAKIGAARRHIYKENIPVQEAFKMVGIPTDGLKGLINQ